LHVTFQLLTGLTAILCIWTESENTTTRVFAPDWLKKRNEAMAILQRESELLELVRLVGYDALSTEEQLFLETARSLREDFLQQDAFDDVDSYCSLRKQYVILSSILLVHEIILDRIRRERTTVHS